MVVHKIRINSMEWALGAFCALMGALMLVAPHQFSFRSYAALQANLPLWGAAFLLAGIALFCVMVLRPPRWMMRLVHLLAGAILLVLAGAFIADGLWFASLKYIVLGLGVAVAPFLPISRKTQPRGQFIDFLSLVMAISSVLAGAMLLLAPVAQFGSSVYDLVRPHRIGIGLLFLVAGLALAAAQLRHRPTRTGCVTDWAAHLMVAAAFFVFLFRVVLPIHALSGILYYGGLGLILPLLPWLSPRLPDFAPTSLRARLALILSAATALALIATVAFISNQEERSARAEAVARQEKLAGALADEVATYINLHRTALLTLAKLPGLTEMPHDAQSRLLKAFDEAYPDAFSFTIHGADGALTASSTPTTATLSIADYPIFQEARRTGQPTMAIFVSPTLRRPILSFGVPLRNAAGQFSGLATCSLELTRITQFIARESRAGASLAYLIDGWGRAIAHPDRALVARLASLADTPPVSAFLTSHKADGSLTYAAGQGARLAGYAHVPELDWGVIAERRVSDALASVHNGRDLAFEILLLSLLLAAGVGVTTAHRLTAPLGFLAIAANELAAGHPDAPLPRSNIMEVAHLATAFRKMRDRLVRRTAEREHAEGELRKAKERLEIEVEERTVDLQKANSQLRAVISSISQGVIVADPQGRTLSMNPAALSLHGFSDFEEAYQAINEYPGILETQYPDGRNVPLEDWPLTRALKGETVDNLELHGRRRDTGKTWIGSYSATPVRNPAGEIILCLVTIHDLTAIRQTEQAFRESQANLSLAVEAARIGLWHRDLRSERLTLTDQFKTLFGLPPDDEVTHGSLIQALHPKDRDRVDQAISLALAEQKDYDIEYRTVWPDGSVHWIQAKGRGFYDESGQALRMDGVAMDITRRKESEARLREQGEQLAEADRRKDEFLAMLAHELRNPLAPIRYAVQLIGLSGAENPSLARQREVIERQVTHMARLLDDLLDVSRITRGKIRLQKERLDLRVVVDQAIESSRPFIDERGPELIYSRPPEPVWMDGDLTRLEQVMRNLLNNAIKYTESGGRIQVTLGWQVVEGQPNGPQAVIRVHDTGIGISKEMLPRVFDLFAQADQSLDRSQGGLGIGLTMVHRLVTMHGGSIEAHSAGLGQGSEFMVCLPAVRESGPRRNERKPQEQKKDDHGPTAGESSPEARCQVLVVEDNEDSATSLAELLELWGYAVSLAHDGQSAYAAALKLKPNVMLLDIGLPGMSGYEVARRLRADKALAATTLIALTGYGQDEDRHQALETGFDHHLTKPVDLSELHRLIDKVAHRQAERR